MDSVFSVCQIIEKHREYNLPTFMAFIDYEKAFDRVNRCTLWDILETYGIPQHLIRSIQSLYINNKIKIRCGNLTSEDYRMISQGVRQGCPLSPVLFNIYIDHRVKTWQEHLAHKFRLQHTTPNTLLFADDQVIISNTEVNLQRAV